MSLKCGKTIRTMRLNQNYLVLIKEVYSQTFLQSQSLPGSFLSWNESHQDEQPRFWKYCWFDHRNLYELIAAPTSSMILTYDIFDYMANDCSMSYT